MREKKLIAIGFLVIISVCIQAQVVTIKGVVRERNDNPIELANISIMNTDSIVLGGGITDANGKFSIDLPQTENYRISVSYLGFQPAKIVLKGIQRMIDVGTIILEETDKTLNEVVVMGRHQINKYEKSLIFPTETQIKHSSDGFGLLNNMMIPQIDVDVLRKKITSRGNKVTLLINGRPITDYNEITALRPKDIMHVEFHDMPTGALTEYETVINYITRQYHYGGYISIDGMQQMTYAEGEYLMMARVNRGHSEYSLGYHFDYLNDKNIHRNIYEAFIYPNDKTLYRTETGIPSLEKKQIHHAFFNYNYRTKLNQTNVKFGYSNRQSPENKLLSTQLYEGVLNYSKNLIDISNEKQSNPYLSFYSDFNLKNKQTVYIRGSVDYSKNNYSRSYEEKKENDSSNFLYSTVNEDHISSVLGSIYTKDFSKGKAVSFNITNYTNVSKSDYSGNIQTKEKLVMSETLFLLDISKKWRKAYLSLRLGASSLYQYQREKEAKHYWSYRPGITFRYLISDKSTFQYKGSLSNSFPTLDLFTDTEQNIDFLQKKRGNPFLEIVHIFNNRVSYSYTSNQLNWNVLFDQFYSTPSVKKQIHFEKNYFIHSYINNGNYHFINPEVGIGLKLWNNKLNFRINGGAQLYFITGENNTREADWYINPLATIMYKDFVFNIFYNSSRRGLYASLDSWTRSQRYGLYTTYNKNGASITLGTLNPFSKYRSTKETKLGIYTSKSYLYNGQYDHLFYIKFNYNFSFGQKRKYSDIDSNKNSKSAIMKSSKE